MTDSASHELYDECPSWWNMACYCDGNDMPTYMHFETMADAYIERHQLAMAGVKTVEIYRDDCFYTLEYVEGHPVNLECVTSNLDSLFYHLYPECM